MRIGHSHRALGHVLCLAAIVYGAGHLLAASPLAYHLYRTWRFPQAHGHHLAGRLAATQLAEDDVCLLVGPSHVREAFDEAVMNETVPALRFVNGGTSGGSIFQYEAMAHLISGSRVQPRCIVVGLLSWTLISRELRLNAAGYTDFFDLTNGRELVRHEREDLRVEARDQIRGNTIWPYNRVARHTSRLARSALFAAQERLSWHEPRDVRQFEYWHRELGRAGTYLYDETEPLDGAAWERVVGLYEAEGMFDPDRYGRPEHLASLRATLDRLIGLAPEIIVVRMPQNTFARERLEPLARSAMDAVLLEYADRIHVLDLTTALPDSDLLDAAHLLSHARPAFSRRVAAEIARRLDLETEPAETLASNERAFDSGDQ